METTTTLENGLVISMETKPIPTLYPTITFPGIYTTEMNAYILQNVGIWMFIATLLIIAQDQMSVKIRKDI